MVQWLIKMMMIYYDTISLLETENIFPHADVDGTSADLVFGGAVVCLVLNFCGALGTSNKNGTA